MNPRVRGLLKTLAGAAILLLAWPRIMRHFEQMYDSIHSPAITYDEAAQHSQIILATFGETFLTMSLFTLGAISLLSGIMNLILPTGILLKERPPAGIAIQIEDGGDPARLRRAALHEAAHAVAVHETGNTVLAVTMRADGSGTTTTRWHAYEDPEIRLRDQLLVDSVGQAMDQFDDPDQATPLNAFDDMSDAITIANLLHRIDPESGSTEQFLDQAWHDARRFVRSHEPVIRRLALRLDHAGVYTIDDLTPFLQDIQTITGKETSS
ncbi:hypothetical protein CSQ85_09280 [Bifidobacterium rousetti]|uniref:hypothetical protein n=1 Tax=Bifidobacterium rousetti TaxID=2045439 RepID=UPI00123AED2C|nr:hypothetical protein [Bifidobacterium rousetti]KAA8818343.1 hypothetical protein CSQ85_09280 [Bifidobacterium rousetti]